MLRRAISMGLACLAACLSDPRPLLVTPDAALEASSGDGPGPSDADAHAKTDGQAPGDATTLPEASPGWAYPAPGVLATNTFPAAGMRPRLPYRADLNGDGVLDLVITDQPPELSDGGVFVLFGRRSGFGQTFDLRLAPGLAPYAVALVDVLGSKALDLLVFGAPDGGDSYLLVYEQVGPPAIFAAPLSRQLTEIGAVDAGPFPTDALPTALLTGELDDAAGPDLVISTFSNGAWLMRLGTWSGASLAVAPLNIFLQWPEGDHLLGGRAYPNPAGGRDRLLMFSQYSYRWYEDLVTSGDAKVLVSGLNQYWFDWGDLDADGLADTVSYEAALPTAYLVKPGAVEPRALTDSVPTLDGQIEDLVVAEIDGQAGLDLAILDREASPNRGAIHVYAGLTVGVSTLGFSTHLEIDLPLDADAHILAVGDFTADGRAEIRAFHRATGAALCYEVVGSPIPKLQACR